MIHASLLEDRAVLALGGAEAGDFLQGLITNDMALCVGGQAIYATLLTPQGKILFDFFVVPQAKDELLIDCAGARAGDLMKRLTLYRLRAKVEIASRPELAVAAFWSDGGPSEIPHGVIGFADPRHPALGQRMIAARDMLARAMSGTPNGDYYANRLMLGIPDSADLAPDSVFALDAGLEELNGVSFRKGCYIGQEVTARMKHRASARRRFLIAETDGALPSSGTPLESGGREVGVLANGIGSRALALVRLDRLTEAQTNHSSIVAAGRPITLKIPGWFRG
jgi:folate-binding protein YgfZ